MFSPELDLVTGLSSRRFYSSLHLCESEDLSSARSMSESVPPAGDGRIQASAAPGSYAEGDTDRFAVGHTHSHIAIKVVAGRQRNFLPQKQASRGYLSESRSLKNQSNPPTMTTRPSILEPQTQLFVLLSILLLVGQGLAVDLSGRVDAYVEQEMAKYRIPGLTRAIVKSGRILKLKGYGVASVEFDAPANENTIYQLFSVSKIFAGRRQAHVKSAQPR